MILVFGLAWASGCGPGEPPRRATLKGHTDQVTSLAFSPDGTTLASKSDDLTVRTWDVSQARLKRVARPFDPELGLVSFSPDGTRLAVNQATIGVVSWNATTGEERVDYRYPSWPKPAWSCYSVAYGCGLAYSPDGKKLAAGGSYGGESGFVALWNVGTSVENPATYMGPQPQPILSVAFSPGGETLASADLAGEIQLWDVATQRKRATILGHDSSIFAIAYTADGKQLVSASLDRTVKIWDVKDLTESGTFSQHRFPIICLAVNRNGTLVASGDKSGTVLCWELDTMRLVARFVLDQKGMNALAFSPVSDLLASGSRDGTIRLWDLSAWQDSQVGITH